MGVPGRPIATCLKVGVLGCGIVAGCAGAGTQTSSNVPSMRAPRAASVVAPAPAAATTATPPMNAPADPCRIAQGVTDAAITQARAFAVRVMDSQLAAGKYEGEKAELPLESFVVSSWLQCIKTQGGAWAIVLTKGVLSPRSDYEWNGEWVLDGEVALAHVDNSGAIVFAPVSTQSQGGNASGAFANPEVSTNCCAWVFGGLEPIELYDFDGDGEPEVHVGASYGHEGVHERSDELLSFKNGRIEPYAPAAKYAFEAMKDFTGDGIPDLLMTAVLLGKESCGSGFPGDGSGQGFIAHALPGGTFSTDDLAARDFAKQTCPKKPATINELIDVLCARLWGVPSAELELQVRSRFSTEDCDAMMAGRPQKPNASPYFELMLSATDTWVPFTLP